MISKFSSRLFLWSSIVVFGIVPVLIRYSDFSDIIFHQGVVDLKTPVYNSIIIVCAITMAMWFLREQTNIKIPRGFRFRDTEVVAVMLLIWSLLFWLGGGLHYRQNDVDIGLATRSIVLRVSFFTSGVSIVGVSYLYSAGSKGKAQIGLLRNVAIFVYLGVLAGSGSRGIFLIALISMFLGRAFQRRLTGTERGRYSVRELHQVIIKKLMNIGKLAVLAMSVLFLIAVWGATRDNYDNVYFSLMFRLSEPYWHFSFLEWEASGADGTLFIDAVQRVASIPLRWFGFEFSGSVDGTEYFLQEYLGIHYSQGVSLPLTLVGHGFLAGGYLGVFANYFIVAFLMILTNRILLRFLRYSPAWVVSILAYQVSKCVAIYPKTLSGAFLYLGYELFRDIVIIALLALFFGFLRRVTKKIPSRYSRNFAGAEARDRSR